jgi:hypothetical protein
MKRPGFKTPTPSCRKMSMVSEPSCFQPRLPLLPFILVGADLSSHGLRAARVSR